MPDVAAVSAKLAELDIVAMAVAAVFGALRRRVRCVGAMPKSC
jgi:hypothetical protein